MYSLLCIQRIAAQPKKDSETVTFSPLVNTAAISETSIMLNLKDRQTDVLRDTRTMKNNV